MNRGREDRERWADEKYQSKGEVVNRGRNKTVRSKTKGGGFRRTIEKKKKNSVFKEVYLGTSCGEGTARLLHRGHQSSVGALRRQ